MTQIPLQRVRRERLPSPIQRGRPGWSRRPLLLALRAVLGGLLYVGCMLEIVVGIPLLYFALGGPVPR